MIDDLKKLYLRFNYTDENGFIFNAPTLREGEHLSIGFDNKRKVFNIHFTNDTINEPGAKRRNFIFSMSAFRFFLFLNRFEAFYNQSILNLIIESKTNLGKLKKHKFILNTTTASEEIEEKLIHKKKNGRYWKVRKNFDLNLISENFKYIDEVILLENSFYLAYKLKNNNISLQGILYKFENLNGLYFIPIKKYNRFTKHMAIAIYNYLNTYPTEETLPFRQLMYERLKHPNLDKEEAKRLQI